MQAIHKGGVYMQYNETLFGTKIPAFSSSSHNNLLFNFSTKNISVQSLYYNGVELGGNFPDDLYYWQISAESPYSAMSYKNRGGSSGAYTYNKYDGEKNKGNIPIVLATGKPKRDSDYNFDVNGSFDGNVSVHNTGAESLYASKIKTVNNNAPNWYRTDTLPSTVPTQGFFNGTAFITDFNYNDMIAEIIVGEGDYPNTTLANYIANSNTAANRIKSIGVKIYAGSLRSGNSKTRTSLQYATYNENGVQLTQNVGFSGIVTDYRYKVPEVVQVLLDYPYPELCRTETLYAASDYMLLFSGNCGTSLTTFLQCYLLEGNKWEHPDGATGFYLKKSGDSVYNEDDFNYIRKLIAYLGFWFTDGGNVSALLGEDAIDYGEPENVPTGIYQAVIEEGVTTGNFIPLAIARDNDQSKWGNEFRDKNGYDGRTNGGGDTQNRGNLRTVLNRGTIGGSVKWFALTETQLNDLIKWTNTGYQPQNNDQFVLDYKGTNPAEYITTIMYMPFVPKTTGNLRDIFIGPLNTNVQGTQLDYEYGITINLGYHKLDREYNDFRDYKPYTNISLYVPFCGTVELDAAKIYGMTINVKLMVDIATGSCTGLIFVDDLLIDTVSGQLGIKLPLNVFNMADYQDTIINAAYNLKSAERSKDAALIGTYAGAIVAGATSGTGIGLLAGAAGIALGQQKYNNATDTIENIKYNVQHTQPKQTQISTADASNLLGMERNARLIITRPYPIETDINAYGHTMGYACNKQGTLSDFTGFTAVSACDTSGINATTNEKEKILTLLKSGVIIK